jgi:hypothetical protein
MGLHRGERGALVPAAGPEQDPNEWTVMLNEGRGPKWEHHTSQCVSFLLSVLTGEFETEYFPDLSAQDHRFDSNEDILAQRPAGREPLQS